jgi:hypothetical protein
MLDMRPTSGKRERAHLILADGRPFVFFNSKTHIPEDAASFLLFFSDPPEYTIYVRYQPGAAWTPCGDPAVRERFCW